MMILVLCAEPFDSCRRVNGSINIGAFLHTSTLKRLLASDTRRNYCHLLELRDCGWWKGNRNRLHRPGTMLPFRIPTKVTREARTKACTVCRFHLYRMPHFVGHFG